MIRVVVKSLLWVLLLSGLKSNAQLIEKGYYLFPINPGKQAYLSGNMGELRSNHFHAGLDIKTGGTEGLPIYCAADGYVSRVKVSSYGYGLALYIQHPNGQTTVYGHLQSFKTDIQQRAIAEQYKNQDYEIDLYLTKNEFTLKKGDVIGLSGNTGGSGGPHLHWEIRDAYSRVLNPLKGGFTEVKDDIKPVIYKVGFTTLSDDAHIKNEFGFFSFTPYKIATNSYSLADLTAYGDIGISLNANDKLNGTSNNNGVASIEMYIDDKIGFQYINERFTFASSKMINQHIEYQRYQDGFGQYHRCYVADGNSLDFYKSNQNHGVLKLKDTLTHKIKMLITDAYNNQSTLEFKIKSAKINPKFVQTPTTKIVVKTKIYDNILRIAVSNNGKELKYYKSGITYSKSPFYTKSDECIYTFDLRKEIPDSILKGNIKYAFNITHLVAPNREFTAYNKNAIVRFGKGDIKDTLYLQYTEKNDVFNIGNEYTPVYQNLKYILKPQNNYPNKDKTGVYLSKNGNLSYIGGTWLGNNIEFSSTKMGIFVLKEDTKAPVITYLSNTSKSIRIKITDDISGINTWKASLDGTYLLMAFRYQTGVLSSIRPNESIPLKGLFKIEVEDNAGNKKIYSLQL